MFESSCSPEFLLLLKADHDSTQGPDFLKSRRHDKVSQPNGKAAAQEFGKDENRNRVSWTQAGNECKLPAYYISAGNRKSQIHHFSSAVHFVVKGQHGQAAAKTD